MKTMIDKVETAILQANAAWLMSDEDDRTNSPEFSAARAAIKVTFEYLRDNTSSDMWIAMHEMIQVRVDFLSRAYVDGASIRPAIHSYFSEALKELEVEP